MMGWTIWEMLEDWSDMGDSVSEQARSVVNGEPLYEQNPNALRMIRDWAQKYASADRDIEWLANELSDESEWIEPDDEDDES